MKHTILVSTTTALIALTLTACKDQQAIPHDHDGDGKPDHGPGAHDTHDTHHGHDDHDDHDDHGDHDHGQKTAGPNGGRIITSVEPHAEFLVTAGHKVRITFLDDHNKAAPVTGQTVEIVCGDRSKPTMLSFAKEADGLSLLSTGTLPEGNKYPVIATIKTTPDAAPVREKFTLDLSNCPTCEYREYACTCDHSHHHDHGHDDHDHGDHGHDH